MTIDQVVRVSVEATALAAVVALLCAAVPRLRARHKAILWWLVGAKLLLGFVPLPVVKVAAFPAARTIAAPAAAVPREPVPVAAYPAPAPVARVSLRRAAGWAWLAIGSLLSLAAIPDWVRVRRWVKSGRAVDDDAGRLVIARARRAVGLRRTPRVLAVRGLEGPVVTGFFRPTVLLPAEDLERLGPAELEMALAHELAHIARGDLWFGLVPALARRIFFFHPVAWIAEREYAIAREAACDEAVLGRHDADPFVYGRLLFQLTTRRPLRSAIPMSPHSMLRRRLEMIEAMLRRVPIGRAGWALVAVAALSIVPVRLVAKESDDSRCLDIGSGKSSAYVITDGKSHTMCGDMGDVRFSDAQRKKGEDLVWFEVDGQDWVVRDPAVVAQARQLFAKVGALGEQQGTLGERQGVLGEEQGRLGEEMGKLGSRQAELAQWRVDVALERADDALRRAAKAKAAAGDDDAEVRRQLAETEKKLAERADAVDPPDAEGPDDIGKQMEELGARMEALGRQQETLGEQQRVLGDQMTGEAAEAQRGLAKLLEEAMRSGKAMRVN